MQKHNAPLLAFCIIVASILISCGTSQDNTTDMATSIASTFIAGQTQTAEVSQAVTPTPTTPVSYPVNKCMVQNVPAGVGAPFAFEWKECVVAVEIQADNSMKVIFEWQVTRLEPGSMPEGQCLTKASDYQNPNMYMVDDLGNHYANTDVGMTIGACLLLGDDEFGSLTDYFLFPPARPGAKFLIFHDDDIGLQTEPFDITWTD